MIFISFAGENAELARALGLCMRAAGAEVWCSVFKDELDDGRPWRDQVYAALDRCSVFALLVTGSPIDGMTKEESDYALDRYNEHENTRVVAVRSATSLKLPPAYRRLQAVDLPADWQTETSDFIANKLRQWGEIAVPPSESANESTSPPPRDAVPPATATTTHAPARDREERTLRRSTNSTSARSWPKRFAVFASFVVLAWLGSAWFGGGDDASQEGVGARNPPQPSAGERSRPSSDRDSPVATSTVLEMVPIPAGRFLMGDSEPPHAEERPQHEVTVAAFELARTEVTRLQWRVVMGSDPDEAGWCTDRSDDLLPASGMSWYAARTFCDKLSIRDRLDTRRRYRLPSEAEWEYACRAGTKSVYSFGDDLGELTRYAWYFVNSGELELSPTTVWDLKKVQGDWGCKAHRVGQKLPNPWGLFDMHGNVWEWCEDSRHPRLDSAPRDGSPWVDERSPVRAIRGGSFEQNALRARSAGRGYQDPSSLPRSVGFRPARSITVG